MTNWHDDGQAANELQLEREQRALESLMECKRAGARLNYLEALAAELGLGREWERMQADTRP